ncbi:NONE-like protein [Biscogniauxia sp. FL1348]|nr:NONE-like protein [Biscogniauxia sp. FL1348]
MKPPTRIALRLAATRPPAPLCASPASIRRHIHTTPAAPATVTSLHGTGPPPDPPRPAADSPAERLGRRRKQAELLAKAQEIRASQTKSTSSSSSSSSLSSSSSSSSAKNKATVGNPLARKRFWKDVHVREVDGAWEVHLDARPLRRPDTKDIVRLPLSKPLLAAALAHEWDMLVSAQQATRQHLIPLTGIVCRALDIADSDAAYAAPGDRYGEPIRAAVARTLMRYLDTDSLLCWAPPPPEEERRALHHGGEGAVPSLRDLQKRAAERVVGFLAERVWPGVEIEPVLDSDSIVPRGQKESTRQIVEGWIMGLSPWELAGLERGVLASKGLLGAVRLLVEWTEGFVGVGVGTEGGAAFGVEEAARLASIEVDWQTGRWGEVEDTHDVEKEDLRRQLGSVVLLVSGTGKKN